MSVAATSLNFENPIRDAVSRIRFAPRSNNLLVSSWDTILRLYDVDSSTVRFEASSDAALLDCCFQTETAAFSAGSDCSITRCDLHSGTRVRIGGHDDLSTCVEYSDETCQVISAGWDKKIMAWDYRIRKGIGCLKILNARVESMSLCQFNLMVAAGETAYMYDLRNLDGPVQSKETSTELHIKCIRAVPDNSEGFAVGTIDGRVTLEIPDPYGSEKIGYAFRCQPKSKKGRDYLVAVNDIAFNPVMSTIFVTGDNEGYVTAWNARSRKRVYEFPRCSNSAVSLCYNNGGQLLAVASSYSYQEANEIEEPPQIFIHKVDDSIVTASPAGCSSSKMERAYGNVPWSRR